MVLGTGIFLFSLSPMAAAEFSLSRLEMASRSWVDDGNFTLSSVVSADLSLSGGYKYTFLLGFSLDGVEINRVDSQGYLSFRIAQATIRETFGLPLDLSYFIGQGDNFATGDEFSTRYGVSPIGTNYRGFFYFPDGIGGDINRRYNGIHRAQGTGLSLSLTHWENLVPMVYLYHDFLHPPGAIINEEGENLYSGDLRVLLNQNWLKIEFFGGSSWKSDGAIKFRGGLMAHIGAGDGAEFFAQVGVPGWSEGDPVIDHLFLLLEPRLRLDRFAMFLTFFYRPIEYHNIVTLDEKGRADLNITFQYGDFDGGMAGGIELGGRLKVDGSEDVGFRLAPFGTLLTGGLRWDAKVLFKFLGTESSQGMMELFLGVRTAF